MLPQAEQRKKRNSSRVNLAISVTVHTILVLALFYLAARQGLLGKQLKKIAVEMVKEKPPEKPKEPEKPKDEPPKIEQPKLTEAPKLATPKLQTTPSSTVEAPPAVAPPAAELPSFVFEGGKAVQTSADPSQVYKGLLESTIRSRWERPDNIDDAAFVAEVDVAVDRKGRISDPRWTRTSGNKRWDDSVREAIAETTALDSPPPTNFPSRVMVRFDVQEMTEAIYQ